MKKSFRSLRACQASLSIEEPYGEREGLEERETEREGGREGGKRERKGGREAGRKALRVSKPLRRRFRV